MPIRAKTLQVAALCCATPLPSGLRAEGIDTEHIFAFMIGADVGTFGEREFQSQTTGRFGRNGGTYRSLGQELELELVPFRNFRVEVGGEFAAHDISGVPGLEDRRQLTLQGGSLDLRYQFLNRDFAPFGLTVAVGGNLGRIDETSAARTRSFDTSVTLALDRELIPNFLIAALNRVYQPEWTRFLQPAPPSRTRPSAWRSARWCRCVRASCSAARRVISGDRRELAWTSLPARRCSLVRPPISSSPSARG